jgi:hypothetical protein
MTCIAVLILFNKKPKSTVFDIIGTVIAELKKGLHPTLGEVYKLPNCYPHAIMELTFG